MRVGIAGLGIMGTVFAGRLVDAGHEVAGWNRSPDKAKAAAEKGARIAATPAELKQLSDIVISVVTDEKVFPAIYEGPNGLLAGDNKGKLFIEMSTVRPETQKALAMKAKGKGAAIVECPVGGTIGPARDGKLLGFAGGEEADFARAKPLLDQMCRRVEYMGASGAGAAMKLAINLPLLVFWQSFGEAMALVKPLGIPPERLIDIFSDSSGGPNVLKARGAALAKALNGESTGPTTFNIDSIRKDLATMVEEAAALGYDAPVTKQALASFDKASAEGYGDGDGVTLPAHFLARKH